MSAKDIIHGVSARDAILRGVTTLAKAVGVTLGPMGRNVVIEQSFGAPKITKDGVTVAKSITLKDKFEDIGAQMIKQAASSTADKAGDGTTTTVVLVLDFLRRCIECVAAGMNPMDLQRGMNKATKTIIEALKALSKPCTDLKSIAQVGTISANSDSAVGKIIAEAREKVGKDGVIAVEEGRGIIDELELVEGMKLDRGYISPYFVTNKQNMTAELDNPYILLVDKKISNIRDMLTILEAVAKTGRSLFIIAEDIEGEALATLVVNHMRGIVKACPVKAPGFGDRRKEILKDIAILTEAAVIAEELGLSLDKAGIDHLGSAKRIIVDKDNFTIIDGSGSNSDIMARVEELKVARDASTSDYDKEKYNERISKLSGGVAVIRVGEATEIAMKEKKERVEDALNATSAAIEEGIVPGGGVALLRTLESLKTLEGDNPAQTAGIRIIQEGIKAPLYQIVLNAGGEPAVIANKILEGKGNYGYNAATGEYGDMIQMGILDPTKVTRTALQQAVSIAGSIITIECAIAELPKKDGPAAGMPGGMGGMGDMDMM